MSSGKKYDEDKLRFDLLDPEFEEGLVKVLTMGSKKYGDNNWRDLLNKNGIDRCYAALRRHLNLWRKGEKIDKESGLSHLFHISCNAYFLEWFERKLKEKKNVLRK